MAKRNVKFMAVLATAFLSVGAIAGCDSGNADKVATPGQQEAKAGVHQRFVSTASCDDCKGMQNELTLNFTQDGQPDGFTLVHNYIGAKDDSTNHSFSVSGIFAVLKGTSQNPNVVVYHLMPDNDNEPPTYFQRTDDNTLQLLDKKKVGDDVLELKLSSRNYSMVRAAQ